MDEETTINGVRLRIERPSWAATYAVHCGHCVLINTGDDIRAKKAFDWAIFAATVYPEAGVDGLLKRYREWADVWNVAY